MPFGYASAASAVAGLAGSVMSSNAASDAASTQANAANRAADMTQANYQQTRADLSPYRDAGTNALATLQAQLPQLTSQYAPAFSWNPTQAQIEATPGYQFTRDQGLKAVQNSASAKGLGVSGAAMKAAADYSTGLANNTWKDLFNTALTTYNTGFNVDQANKTNAFNKLLGLVGAGQSSAAQTGAFGQSATQNAGNFLTSGANSSAAGQVGSANALSSGLNTAANAGQNYAVMNRLLGNNNGGNNTVGAASLVDSGAFS